MGLCSLSRAHPQVGSKWSFSRQPQVGSAPHFAFLPTPMWRHPYSVHSSMEQTMKKKAIPVPPAGRCVHISEWCAHTAVRAPEHKEERSESETPPAKLCCVHISEWSVHTAFSALSIFRTSV